MISNKEFKKRRPYIVQGRFDWKEFFMCSFNPIYILIGLLLAIPIINFFMWKVMFNYYGKHPDSNDIKHYGIIKKRIYVKINKIKNIENELDIFE